MGVRPSDGPQTARDPPWVGFAEAIRLLLTVDSQREDYEDPYYGSCRDQRKRGDCIHLDHETLPFLPAWADCPGLPGPSR